VSALLHRAGVDSRVSVRRSKRCVFSLSSRRSQLLQVQQDVDRVQAVLDRAAAADPDRASQAIRKGKTSSTCCGRVADARVGLQSQGRLGTQKLQSRIRIPKALDLAPFCTLELRNRFSHAGSLSYRFFTELALPVTNRSSPAVRADGHSVSWWWHAWRALRQLFLQAQAACNGVDVGDCKLEICIIYCRCLRSLEFAFAHRQR